MKESRTVTVCTIILFIVLNVTHLFPAGKGHYQYVFNPMNMEPSVHRMNWRTVLDRFDVRSWAKSHGMAVLDDREPVVDNRAVFVSEFGSRLIVAGLDRERRYTLWLDFVTFVRPRHGLPVSNLEISARGSDGRFVRFHTVSLGEFTGLYRLDIPYEFTVNGRVELRFYDTSRYRNLWGMWDIIVTDEKTGPRDVAREKGNDTQLPESDRIIE